MSWNVIRPYGPRVLIVLDTRREFYDASSKAILLPETARKQPETGRVVAIGTSLGEGWRAATWDGAKWQGGTRVMFGKWNGTPVDPPEFDPKGEYFIMRAPVYNERGAKLPVPVEGRTHMPVFDDIAAIIDDDEDMATRAAMDLPRARFK